jgi:hypothetical protein
MTKKPGIKNQPSEDAPIQHAQTSTTDEPASSASDMSLDSRHDLQGLSPEQVTEAMTDAMARAFHVCAWADAREERGMQFPPQTKIEEVAPETSAAAKKHALEIAKEIVELNRLSLFDLAKKAMIADTGESNPAISEETAHELGWYMGMESLGHGVSWMDDHEDFGLELPLTEFYPDFSSKDLRMHRSLTPLKRFGMTR